ncbi:acyl-CoA Delta-9 desaturase-like [Anticarsia gemmatalis]|uniref:acyl-CoA Delta-9 desaturase-like n=1 Tax=Anticarsia gemmatalis TaxID=129554 RepID=UPI003F75745D
MIFFSGMGITCGVHRLFTHKSYKVNTPLKLFLIACYSSAGQNSIYQWVRDHRLHHKFSDTEADPHNANRGFFFSHIGWLMMKKNEEVKKQGKKIDMSDITSDRMIMLQHKYFFIYKLVFCYIIPTYAVIYLCGENWRCAVAWQCFIRFLFVLHNELSVNSFAHIYGYTPYNKNILPKQNRYVSTTTFGEGWHNYHHMFPFDYKAAEFCDSLNLSAVFIKWWETMGWAYDLKEASPEMVKDVIKRLGDDPYENIRVKG